MAEGDHSRQGRGATISPNPRYLPETREVYDDGWDDGWQASDVDIAPLRTSVTQEHPKTIINRNRSPDLPFNLSINPYRGCEHGCVYCYARPAHAYVDLSPGLDFESRLFSKPNAAVLLRNELTKKNYRCEQIALGANTDAYQPIERRLQITREILQVLHDCNHPVSIVTKSALVERDIDLLAPMAERGLAQVFISVTSLDRELSRRLEPRAAAPQRRIAIIENLANAGVPTGVMFAPVIPALNDDQLERVLEAAAVAGAQFAGFVMLRMPHEIKDLFKDWLAVNYPLRKEHVLNRIRDTRAGRENDARFGSRLKGTGQFAELIAQRFRQACKRHGLDRSRHEFNTTAFSPPREARAQLDLFATED